MAGVGITIPKRQVDGTSKQEARRVVFELKWHWLRGIEDGWRWAENASDWQLERVSKYRTLNERLVTEGGLATEYADNYYAKLNAVTDSYFDDLLEEIIEFELIEIDPGNPYSVRFMNTPFRAYWDGWQDSVREYGILIYQEGTGDRPDIWAR